MKDQVDLQGASGALYRFQLFKEGRPLSPMGGNWVYARDFDGEVTVVHCGEGENILALGRQRWDEAVAMHNVTHLYTRLNISQGVRRYEHADIAAAYRPPMNPRPVEPEQPIIVAPPPAEEAPDEADAAVEAADETKTIAHG